MLNPISSLTGMPRRARWWGVSAAALTVALAASACGSSTPSTGSGGGEGGGQAAVKPCAPLPAGASVKAPAGATQALKDALASANGCTVRVFVSTDAHTPADATKLSAAIKADLGVDITVELVNGQPDPIYAGQLAKEAAAGEKPKVDLFTTTPNVLQTLKTGGVVDQVDWKSLGVPEADLWSPLDAVYSADIARTILINTTKVPAADAPHSVADLLDPKWKGKIITAGLPDVFAPLAISMGPQGAADFVTKLLKDQKAALATNPTAMRAQVASGQYSIGFGVRIGKALLAAKAPVGYAPAKVPVVPRGSAVVKGAKSVPAAEVVAYWLAETPNGRQESYQVFDWPRYTTPDTDLFKLNQDAGGVDTADLTWWTTKYGDAVKAVAGVLRSG